jgi:hypothetical protein
LAGIRRIGSDFLVAGQRCIENDLSLALARSAITVATKDAPVFERQN